MEISYLNYKQICLDDTTKQGRVYYDPSEKSLIFYYDGEEQSFIRKLEEIKVIPHFLRDYKIAFKDEETESLISIECDKKESLDIKTYRYVLNKIISNTFKLDQEKNKVESKYFKY